MCVCVCVRVCVCVCVCTCTHAYACCTRHARIAYRPSFVTLFFFFFLSQRFRDKTIKNATITEFRYASLMIRKFSVAQMLAFAYSHIASQGLSLDRKVMRVIDVYLYTHVHARQRKVFCVVSVGVCLLTYNLQVCHWIGECSVA